MDRSLHRVHTPGDRIKAIACYHKGLKIAKITCKAGDLKLRQKRYVDAVNEYRLALGMDSVLSPTMEMTHKKFETQILRNDRRRHERYLLKLPVELSGEDGTFYSVSSVDVSKSGILIESSRKLEIGSQVVIRAALLDDAQKISLSGKIVRLDRVTSERDYRDH